VIGTDISSGMIGAAWQHVQASPHRDRIELRVDPAEELPTVDDEDSVDVALCVEAIEHMLDQASVVRQVGSRLYTRLENGQAYGEDEQTPNDLLNERQRHSLSTV
jgi:2-polyprenyl-3-methyl-5-hydroxy-6-metoxy-1,4-benzoquinol methylase